MRMLKRLMFTVSALGLYILSVFFVPAEYYARWFVIGLAFLFLSWLVSYIPIPSKRRAKIIADLTSEFQKNQKQETDVREDAVQLELVCPACSAADNYWPYLETGLCPKCGSGLWSARTGVMEESYGKLLRKYEAIKAFKTKLSPSTIRRLRNYAIFGLP